MRRQLCSQRRLSGQRCLQFSVFKYQKLDILRVRKASPIKSGIRRRKMVTCPIPFRRTRGSPLHLSVHFGENLRRFGTAYMSTRRLKVHVGRVKKAHKIYAFMWLQAGKQKTTLCRKRRCDAHETCEMLFIAGSLGVGTGCRDLGRLYASRVTY